jgi:hypothetical protein
MTVATLASLSALTLSACGSTTPAKTSTQKDKTSKSQPKKTTTPSKSTNTTPPATTVSACTFGDLRVAFGAYEGTAGTTYLPIQFTNVSTTTCTIGGYPGVSALGANDQQIGPSAVRTTGQSYGLVTLAPGATASAAYSFIVVQNAPSSTCLPETATALKIYPPNSYSSVSLPFSGQLCSTHSFPTHIGPIYLGKTGAPS